MSALILWAVPAGAIAEKFHSMSEQLLAALNPGKKFDCAGEAIGVVDTGVGEDGESPKADRIEVDKTRQTVKLFDKSNALIGFYPATVGSKEKPSPSGTLKVTEVSRNPTYRYNPEYHFKGVRSDKSFASARPQQPRRHDVDQLVGCRIRDPCDAGAWKGLKGGNARLRAPHELGC